MINNFINEKIYFKQLKGFIDTGAKHSAIDRSIIKLFLFISKDTTMATNQKFQSEYIKFGNEVTIKSKR